MRGDGASRDPTEHGQLRVWGHACPAEGARGAWTAQGQRRAGPGPLLLPGRAWRCGFTGVEGRQTDRQTQSARELQEEHGRGVPGRAGLTAPRALEPKAALDAGKEAKQPPGLTAAHGVPSRPAWHRGAQRPRECPERTPIHPLQPQCAWPGGRRSRPFSPCSAGHQRPCPVVTAATASRWPGLGREQQTQRSPRLSPTFKEPTWTWVPGRTLGPCSSRAGFQPGIVLPQSPECPGCPERAVQPGLARNSQRPARLSLPRAPHRQADVRAQGSVAAEEFGAEQGLRWGPPRPPARDQNPNI